VAQKLTFSLPQHFADRNRFLPPSANGIYERFNRGETTMNRIKSRASYLSHNQVNGIIAAAIVLAIALGCTCNKEFNLANEDKPAANSKSSDNPFGKTTDDDAEPDNEQVAALVRETMSDFTDAIRTGDFSTLYEKASSDFQSTYTEDQTAAVFKEFVDKKSLVLPILAKTDSMQPIFDTPPSIRNEKGLDILVANGKYDTKPVPVRFEYEYVKRGGEWKMLKLIVKLTK
jgi:ABC-type transporter MlaC component